jgi:hypothetical protein
MRKRSFLMVLVVVGITGFISCTKKAEAQNTNNPETKAVAAATGDSWIVGHWSGRLTTHTVDSSTSEDITGIFDFVFGADKSITMTIPFFDSTKALSGTYSLGPDTIILSNTKTGEVFYKWNYKKDDADHIEVYTIIRGRTEIYGVVSRLAK